ncbi:uncharacterized protein SPAPADRAFT_67437 [Spathaspora passalidarum NRRL Y-27907]|uniref:Uncharacterized protein n=1 Tax=Spathaspora passalidarum (strain NRRL Y-27907 / 11-Y1) TaxID=619300 RepID=G3ARV3_SPAPN|nr:uncharacterized protein SPAPADRAFT_67437 [Spathaspora passalidarum NRRL Y-27907]EGW31370.1 hypothetical protein SPAPADRAFT_67437 [Spathaspora passalidarum NRRL Y-27907]
MSLQLKKPVNKAKNLKFSLAAGAVILGTGYLVLNTFPHLKTSIWNYITGERQQEREVQEEEIEEEQSNEPIELHESQVDLSASKLHDQSYVDIAEWSNDNLKSWLSRKRSTLPLMLLMITLCPLLNQFRKILHSYNVIFNVNITQIILSLLISIQRYFGSS